MSLSKILLVTDGNIAWDAVPPPTTVDTTEAVVVDNFKTALILNA